MTHKLHLYTGPGKGKTTAAMGLALRALGHGKTVLIAQFMKDGRSGELAALRALKGAHVVPPRPIGGFTFRMTESEKAAASADQTAFSRELCGIIRREDPDLVVLDELANALRAGLVDEENARQLLCAALSFGECAVTGRGAPAWLHEAADYVSLIEDEKHPFRTEGLEAREGIEW